MYCGLCSVEAKPLKWVFIVQNVYCMLNAYQYISSYSYNLFIASNIIVLCKLCMYLNGKLTLCVNYH